MRGVMLVAWLFIPLFAAAYHYGPGQDRVKLDEAAVALDEADALRGQERWGQAVAAYEDALRLVPGERRAERQRIRLELAKAQLEGQQLAQAREDLEGLAQELLAEQDADAELVRDTREALASAQYYNTWLMRLEGQPQGAWESEIEAARQHYRLLAETASDPARRSKHQQDLSAAIRLARMDLSELQGLPIPSQCQGCKSCNKPGKKKKGKKRGPKPDARGAGMGPPSDDEGS